MLHLDHVTSLGRLVDRSLELVADKDQTQSNYTLLREMRDFIAFLEAEIPGLVSRWQAHREALQAEAAGTDPSATETGGTP